MDMRYTIYSGIAVLLLMAACKEQAPPPAALPPVEVTVEPVQSRKVVYYEDYPATVTALNLVELRPQVSGFITGIHFRDGDRVKKGQLLYSIDAQLYNSNYEQAVASLSVQEANLVKAQKDADRYRELARHDAVARQLVDNAEAALEVARKQVEAATANISAVQTSVRYTKIYAPFDGLIGISQVKAGAAVTAGQTLLNTVSTDAELAVDFNIEQRNIYQFLRLVETPSDDSTFLLAFGKEIYPHPGKLAFLDRAVDPQTGNIKARLVFPNPHHLLRAGMNATVRVKNGGSEESLLIPYKAVTEMLGEYFVYVPGDSNKVFQQRIVPGKVIGSEVVITEGLESGETIVTEGIQRLRHGTVVQPVSAAADNGQHHH